MFAEKDFGADSLVDYVQMEEKMIGVEGIAEIMDCHPNHAQRVSRAEDFPKPRKIVGRKRLWLAGDVRRWLAYRGDMRIFNGYRGGLNRKRRH